MKKIIVNEWIEKFKPENFFTGTSDELIKKIEDLENKKIDEGFLSIEFTVGYKGFSSNSYTRDWNIELKAKRLETDDEFEIRESKLNSRLKSLLENKEVNNKSIAETMKALGRI